MTLAIGDTLVIIASQYWGQKKTKPIRTFTGIALTTGLILGLTVFILTTLFPREILMIFTKKESYIIQGMDYLSLIRFTYPLFVLSTILMVALRSVETVSIALKISSTLQKKHFHAFSRFCGHHFYQIRYGHLRHQFKQES